MVARVWTLSLFPKFEKPSYRVEGKPKRRCDRDAHCKEQQRSFPTTGGKGREKAFTRIAARHKDLVQDISYNEDYPNKHSNAADTFRVMFKINFQKLRSGSSVTWTKTIMARSATFAAVFLLPGLLFPRHFNPRRRGSSSDQRLKIDT